LGSDHLLWLSGTWETLMHRRVDATAAVPGGSFLARKRSRPASRADHFPCVQEGHSHRAKAATSPSVATEARPGQSKWEPEEVLRWLSAVHLQLQEWLRTLREWQARHQGVELIPPETALLGLGLYRWVPMLGLLWAKPCPPPHQNPGCSTLGRARSVGVMCAICPAQLDCNRAWAAPCAGAL
jgi:hypothetical protein